MYRELTKGSRPAQLLGIFLLAVALGLVTVSIYFISTAALADGWVWVGIIGGPLGSTFAGFCLIWNAIILEVDDTEIRLQFWPFWSKTIPADMIIHCHPTTLNSARFGGFGLRSLPGGVRALLFTSGPGLEVLTTEHRRYFIRTHHQRVAFQAIANAQNNAART